MAKKLKVELDVDNAEAKRKVKEAVDAGSSGGSSPPPTPMPPAPGATGASGKADDSAAKAAERAARGMDSAARSARNLSNGAEESSRSLKDVARSFAGLGVGMSIRFARQFVEQGSTADKTLGIGENAANLGFMGAKMGGPWGAVIGAVAGAGKGWMENGKAEADQMRELAKRRDANLESFKDWQTSHRETLDFKKTIDALTNAHKSDQTPLEDRRNMVAEEIKKREDADKELSRGVIYANSAVDNSTPENLEKTQAAFAKAMAKFQANAAQLDQLRELQKRLDDEAEPRHRNGMSAPDALARIGGDSGGGDWNFRELAANSREQLSVLKSIDSKTGKGETTWQ